MNRVAGIVIGAGVVGLAIARQMAQAGHDVIVLEATGTIGSGASSRNSEVIHAGIYYPPGSLMAQLCRKGRDALYAYCESHGIPHRRCGKLIVATEDGDIERLAAIHMRGQGNGVSDLREISAREAKQMEPALACVAALVSPSTGIVDSHALMLALRGEAEDAGAMIAFHAPVVGIESTAEGFLAETGGSSPARLNCRWIVNSAGLEAPIVAGHIDAMPRDKIPRRYFARGNYFTLSGRAPFSRLIYPVPQPGGLGVHLTIDMAGQARFGPDVEWIETIDYRVDPAKAARFYPAIRRYWPDLRDGSLAPAYAGIRPKIVPPEIAAQDFIIQGPDDHGIAGLVNLFGIESPGLTASLAIADEVASRLHDAL